MSNTAVAKIDFDQEQLQVIESQFFPAGATKAEQQFCFAVARELGLNPITREIYFVPRRQKVGDKWINKIEPMVGRDGFLAIAHKSGQLAGIESSCSIQDVPQLENGKWVIKPELVAVSTVWRKDSNKPFTVQVSYSEYCQKSSDGTPTKFWAEKSKTMLIKTADSQALRKAFNIHGVYCPEEVGDGFETVSGEIITLATEAEYTRADTKSHLSVVPPPSAVTMIDSDEDQWPDPPEVNRSASRLSVDDVGSEIIALLEGKNIPYDLDIENGIIGAKSYNERQLLKDSGFKWNAESKNWIFKFEPVESDPF